MKPAPLRSGLLGQILWRVLPVSVLLLLAIWYGAAEVTRTTVEAEVRGGLRREADHRADAIATRIAILQDAARAFAANDLIVNSLVDLHDGTFDLQSKLRDGTVVTAMFPRQRVMQALPRLAEPGENVEAPPQDAHPQHRRRA